MSYMRYLASEAEESDYMEQLAMRKRMEDPPPFNVVRSQFATDCDGSHGPYESRSVVLDQEAIEAMIGSEMFTAESKSTTHNIEVGMYTMTSNNGSESGSIDINVQTEEGSWSVTLEWEQDE